ncbi:trihelix transcription factor GT-2-like protein [Corchorus olitorius]|uniref:Trihelix transcription factor GT-2-like protein n=1 Tax=Corchorus olitorius TaxID=93759 RepID=A0A1R3KUF2_9ROSI|nr:trihelix transcription factor GT-2-like protein [Corchorus olitorius]
MKQKICSKLPLVSLASDLELVFTNSTLKAPKCLLAETFLLLSDLGTSPSDWSCFQKRTKRPRAKKRGI